MAGGTKLTQNQMQTAMATVAQWRHARSNTVACPVCGADGLDIDDRSTRPHAEWYALTCKACGLNESIHIPLGMPRQDLD
jgi:transcription elongation factor Elf1